MTTTSTRVGTALETGVIVRKLVLTVVGVLLFAASLTVVFEGMRAVMEVGGMCASGGPYEIRQECPDGAGLIVLGIFSGLFATGLVVAGTFRGGPQLWVLAWPALFIALGWNFLEFGVDPPPPEDGLVWGWLICGVLFVAMGGIPLLFVLANAKATLWGSGGETHPAAVAAATRRAAAHVSSRVAQPRSTVTRPITPTTPAPAREPDHREPDDETETDDGTDRRLVSDLERLATLHERGQLTDEEFARAKDARLAEEER